MAPAPAPSRSPPVLEIAPQSPRSARRGPRWARRSRGLASRRNAAFLRVALDQMDHRAGRVGQRAGDDDARETRRRNRDRPRCWRRGRAPAICSEFGDMPGPKMRDGRGRDQVRPGLPFSSRATKRSSRADVSRETGVSGQGPIAGRRRGRDGGARACSCHRPTAALRCRRDEMRDQQRERRRRDARRSGRPGRSCAGGRLTSFWRTSLEARQLGIIESSGSVRPSSRR